jgi:hypothetical protein
MRFSVVAMSVCLSQVLSDHDPDCAAPTSCAPMTAVKHNDFSLVKTL